MARTLLLLRNGKAFSDLPRSLKDGGKRQVQRIGVWLAGQDLIPDLVVTATSERALVSAQKALKAGGASAGRIRQSALLGGGARLAEHLSLLRDLPQTTGRPMIVAHRKCLERLVRHLTGEQEFALGTGTLMRLSMPDDWADLPAGCADLSEVVRPEALPERFPYPGPGGSEWRDRPAYYYTQSAAVPWRLTDGRLEILVITSSKRNHWVVPKGIHEPGLSAQDSAAREAEEEAGVLGEVGDAALGSFEVEKWGGTCQVVVYPMRVTRFIEDRHWDESHRSRIWVDPEQAVAHLKHDGLKRIVAEFASSFAG